MTRSGKIARLPRELRDQINRRLDNGEPTVPLAEWLNGLVEVQQVLQKHFGGRPISQQNLSEWKRGGYRDWLAGREILAQAGAMEAHVTDLTGGISGRLTDHLATVLAAHYAAMMSQWNGRVSAEFTGKLRSLRALTHEIVALRRGDHDGAWASLERQRLEHQWAKTMAALGVQPHGGGTLQSPDLAPEQTNTNQNKP